MIRDFAAFVSEYSDRALKEAGAVLEDSLAEAAADGAIGKVSASRRSVLLHTVANEILWAAWEGIGEEGRRHYRKIEEVDRQRFINEEGIADSFCSSITRKVKTASQAAERTPRRAAASAGNKRKNGDGFVSERRSQQIFRRRENGASRSQNNDDHGQNDRHARNNTVAGRVPSAIFGSSVTPAVTSFRDLVPMGRRRPFSACASVHGLRVDGWCSPEDGLGPPADGSGGWSDSTASDGLGEAVPHTFVENAGGQEAAASSGPESPGLTEEESTGAPGWQSLLPDEWACMEEDLAGLFDDEEDPPKASGAPTCPLPAAARRHTMVDMYGNFAYQPGHATCDAEELLRLAWAVPVAAHPRSKNKRRDLARFDEERQKFLEAAKTAQKREKEGCCSF